MKSLNGKIKNTKKMNNSLNRSYDINDDNGSIFFDKYYIPEEVLSMILSYVEPKDLVFTCRRVCKYWCNVVDSQIWRIKFGRHNLPVSRVRELPWFACFWILLKNPFDRNLVKNSCGQEGLKHWKILSNEGNLWKVEKSPEGCSDFPKESSNNEDVKVYNSCFATSYDSCSKEQIIDLSKEGAVPQVMDTLQPKITVSEWYCGRWDSRSTYEFKTALLDKDQGFVDDYEMKKNIDSPEGYNWQKVSHTFENYGQGVRYVWIYHYGQDLMFWKGHYGSKMTGSSIVLTLSSSLKGD